jgi:hypothetical protein
MRALLIAAAVALLACLAGFVQPTAMAAPPEAVLIQAHPVAFFPVEFGPWTSTGAISDAGGYERTEVRTSPPDRPFGSLGPVHEEFLFTGSQGTFTVMAEERDSEGGVVGVWQIVSGTGGYERASGHGTVAFTAVPGLFTLSLTGVATKVGDA